MDSGSGELASAIQKFVEKSQQRDLKTLLFTHRQADLDALCSASAVSRILQRLSVDTCDGLKIECTLIAPSGVSLLTRAVSERLGVRYDELVGEEQIQSADLIFALDTGDPSLLADYSSAVKSSSATKVVVDHHKHSQNSWPDFDFVLVNPEATSTCEIISLEFDSSLIDKKTATELMIGLLFDSQHLGIATENTLKAALKLVRAGARIDEAKSLLKNRTSDRSELIAKMKSAQRMQFWEIGSHFVARSEVSSFHASVARMLVEIGADAGIAFGKSSGEARISIRCTQKFCTDSKIDLGITSEEIARSVGGIGGGHPTAASISGNFDPSLVAEKILEKFKVALLKK